MSFHPSLLSLLPSAQQEPTSLPLNLEISFSSGKRIVAMGEELTPEEAKELTELAARVKEGEVVSKRTLFPHSSARSPQIVAHISFIPLCHIG